jgi:hypothetical protein
MKTIDVITERCSQWVNFPVVTTSSVPTLATKEHVYNMFVPFNEDNGLKLVEIKPMEDGSTRPAINDDSKEVRKGSRKRLRCSKEVPKYSRVVEENIRDVPGDNREALGNSREILGDSRSVPEYCRELSERSRDVPEYSKGVPKDSRDRNKKNYDIPVAKTWLKTFEKVKYPFSTVREDKDGECESKQYKRTSPGKIGNHRNDVVSKTKIAVRTDGGHNFVGEKGAKDRVVIKSTKEEMPATVWKYTQICSLKINCRSSQSRVHLPFSKCSRTIVDDGKIVYKNVKRNSTQNTVEKTCKLMNKKPQITYRMSNRGIIPVQIRNERQLERRMGPTGNYLTGRLQEDKFCVGSLPSQSQKRPKGWEERATRRHCHLNKNV